MHRATQLAKRSRYEIPAYLGGHAPTKGVVDVMALNIAGVKIFRCATELQDQVSWGPTKTSGRTAKRPAVAARKSAGKGTK